MSHTLLDRVTKFIRDHDPFGDCFSDHELSTLSTSEEIERLRNILSEAHNFWRHDFRDEVEAAADRIFKKFSVENTVPFADRRAAEARVAALPTSDRSTP